MIITEGKWLENFEKVLGKGLNTVEVERANKLGALWLECDDENSCCEIVVT